ncbi:trypsin-like serine protease [Actinomadura logoneensis]|uniref:trypsin-like serine protease n=1 Tax=Actinomadura logoneensis TaxID=2293572 RepID=UPI0022A736B5|nr:trypsin-like serine protease [Actinomadura logoneensis]
MYKASCASGGPRSLVRGPCGGDSGSPLLTRVGDHWQVEGVDSRGVSDICGGGPDIYTGTGSHYAWIRSVVG